MSGAGRAEGTAGGSRKRTTRWAGLAPAVVCGLVLAAGTASQWGARFVMDDSLMFVRYADNWLGGRGISWNPGEGPVYGPTSLLYVGAVAAFRLPGLPPAAAVQVASLFFGVVFLSGSVALSVREGGAGAGLLVLAGPAHATPSLTAHFTTGMDTTFAMAFLSGWLLLAGRAVAAPGRGQARVAGACGGLFFCVRPELLVFAAAVPLAVAAEGADPERRRRAMEMAGGAAALAAAQAGAAYAYFGTPLPLSFYAKGLHGYGRGFESHYRHVAPAEFVDFLSNYWILLLPVAAERMLHAGARRTPARAFERGVGAAVVLVLAYHLFLVLPVMPYRERFFHPVLPGLALLAASSAVRLSPSFEPGGALRACSPSKAALLATVLVGAVLSPRAVEAAKDLRKAILSGDVGTFDLVATYRRTRQSRMWYRLESFSGLPQDLALAATEVGLPAVLNPKKKVVDMTGLNEPVFAQKGFSPERLLRHDRPDLIYMPHPHYERMRARLTAHPAFRSGYLHLPAQKLGCTLGLALRKDSPFFARMLEVVEGESREVRRPARGEGEE